MGKKLSVEVMYRARELYEEKDERGRNKYSMMEVAAMLGISETSVLRAVKNMGRFANSQNDALRKVLSDPELEEAAAGSLLRLQKMLAEEKREQSGEKANEALEELIGKHDGTVLEPDQKVKDMANLFLGKDKK